ncbi:hypothetical protein NL64_01950 [Pseudomonas fluorescens]|uniref:hypothetical protein n=1 Tax=Pseudomonas fluorescens TaxID=294 RepID=UPI00054C2E15|nr:hypothetical protein [Pseudomonas fluorescens]KII37177.1 hypothetical protein NL64_01950 [Pseudomonas fluorescens]
MTDKPVGYRPYSRFEDGYEDLPLDSNEIEVRLAIADYVIRRVAGTPTGESIFKGLVKHFENRYPHHKLLALYLTSPESLVPEGGVSESEAEVDDGEALQLLNRPNKLDYKLLESLLHFHPDQEPSGPLAGLSFDLTARGVRRRKK